MERLTQTDDFGNWSLKGVSWKDLYSGNEITTNTEEKVYAALCKLKDYEESGLTPEQVQELTDSDMETKIDVTLSLFFEIKDAEIFGGVGEVGYVEEKWDLKTDNLANVKLQKLMQRTISRLAKMLEVPEENVRAISRTEYEENTEE